MQKKVKAEELINDAHRDSDVHEGDFFSLFYYDECERSSDQYSLKIKQKVWLQLAEILITRIRHIRCML